MTAKVWGAGRKRRTLSPGERANAERRGLEHELGAARAECQRLEREIGRLQVCELRARAAVWREVLEIIDALPIERVDLATDAEYAERIGITDQFEALSVAVARILRAASAATDAQA